MPETKKTQELLTKRVIACKKRALLPEDLIDLIATIYNTQLESRPTANISLENTELTDSTRRAQGAPLVNRGSFPFDKELSRSLFQNFLEFVLDIPSLRESASALAEALQKNSLDLDQAMQAHLDNDEAFFATWAAEPAPRLLPMLVQAAMTPSLERAAEALAQHIDLQAPWTHGHCPMCGSLPVMTDLRKKEGLRYNICDFCHTEYRVPRLQCPFCLENDATKLKYYETEEEPGLRINACETCHMYIKQTDFRDLNRKPLPLIDDLDSLGLDIAACEYDLRRPTLSSWGF